MLGRAGRPAGSALAADEAARAVGQFPGLPGQRLAVEHRVGGLQRRAHLFGVDRREIAGRRRVLEFDGLQFERCSFKGTDFTGAQLDDTRFTGCRGAMANFTAARLDTSTWRSSDLNNARFTGASLSETVFTGCKLTGADFSRSRHVGIAFIETTLEARP